MCIDVKESFSDSKFDLIKQLDIVEHDFEVDYDYWTTEQILYSVMPEGDAETPSSFTTTGHIGNQESCCYLSRIQLMRANSSCQSQRGEYAFQGTYCSSHFGCKNRYGYQ